MISAIRTIWDRGCRYLHQGDIFNLLERMYRLTGSQEIRIMQKSMKGAEQAMTELNEEEWEEFERAIERDLNHPVGPCPTPRIEAALEKIRQDIEKSNIGIDKKANYYDTGGMSVMDVLKAKLTPEQFKGFLLGNIIKYSLRLNWKGTEKDDTRKINTYSSLLKELGERGNNG